MAGAQRVSMWGQVSLPKNENFDAAAAAIDAAPRITQASLPAAVAGVVKLLFGSEPVPVLSPDAVAAIHIHPTRPLVSVTQSNVVTLFVINETQFPMTLGSSMSLSSHRFNESICSFAWTHESQNSFVVGTATGVFYCTLPSASGENSFDVTNVDIRPIPLPEKLPFDMVATAPHGRLFACCSSKKSGSLYVGDAWMRTASLLQTIDSASVTHLYWLETMPCLVAAARGGEVLLVDAYRWESDHYSVTDHVDLAALAPVTKSNGLFACAKDALEVFYLELINTIDQRGVLLKQAPTMKVSVDVSRLKIGESALHSLSIKNISTCALGELLSVVFENGSQTHVEVGMYVCSREHAKLSVTFLKTISRGDSGQVLAEPSMGAGAVVPLRTAIGTLPGRKLQKVVYVLWSDQELTFHVM